MSGRTVIIGGAGFLGTALAQGLLAEGRKVCVLDLPDRIDAVEDILEGVETLPFGFPALDGLDDALVGVETLIHLACTTTPASSMQDMARDAAENIAPSVAIFQAAGRAGVSQIIFASSGGTVYGDPTILPVPENAAGGPLSAYGVSKLAIENYLHLTAKQTGFTGISLRIGNPYGPFQLRGTTVGLIANYLAQVHAGYAPEVWGDGSVIRDYIHISDLVSAVSGVLATRDLKSGAYNVGSGEGRSIIEIYAAICQITGTSLDLKYRPARGFDVSEIYFDTTRLRAATGWAPRVSLEAGIEELWNIILENR